MKLKERFIDAVKQGKLGKQEKTGIIVTLKEFRQYFSDIESQYVNSFLPASTIQPGQLLSRTQFVYRVRKGVYRVHPKVLE